jgi:hypothetical protein
MNGIPSDRCPTVANPVNPSLAPNHGPNPVESTQTVMNPNMECIVPILTLMRT